MKFGGTSVEDTAAFRNVTSIVKVAAASRPVVVVSAIGGFTNNLLQSVELAIAGDSRGATKSLDKDFDRHLTIAKDLLGKEAQAAFVSTIGDARGKIRQLPRLSPRIRLPARLSGRDRCSMETTLGPVARRRSERKRVGRATSMPEPAKDRRNYGAAAAAA